MGPYKTKLKKILEQVDNDMIEEIMEMNHNLDRPSFYDMTDDEAKGIIETLRHYQSEGLTIQGESIQKLNLQL